MLELTIEMVNVQQMDGGITDARLIIRKLTNRLTQRNK